MHIRTPHPWQFRGQHQRSLCACSNKHITGVYTNNQSKNSAFSIQNGVIQQNTRRVNFQELKMSPVRSTKFYVKKRWKHNWSKNGLQLCNCLVSVYPASTHRLQSDPPDPPETAAVFRRVSPRQMQLGSKKSRPHFLRSASVYLTAESEIPLDYLQNLLANTKERSERQDAAWTGKVELQGLAEAEAQRGKRTVFQLLHNRQRGHIIALLQKGPPDMCFSFDFYSC